MLTRLRCGLNLLHDARAIRAFGSTKKGPRTGEDDAHTQKAEDVVVEKESDEKTYEQLRNEKYVKADQQSDFSREFNLFEKIKLIKARSDRIEMTRTTRFSFGATIFLSVAVTVVFMFVARNDDESTWRDYYTHVCNLKLKVNDMTLSKSSCNGKTKAIKTYFRRMRKISLKTPYFMSQTVAREIGAVSAFSAQYFFALHDELAQIHALIMSDAAYTKFGYDKFLLDAYDDVVRGLTDKRLTVQDLQKQVAAHAKSLDTLVQALAFKADHWDNIFKMYDDASLCQKLLDAGFDTPALGALKQKIKAIVDAEKVRRSAHTYEQWQQLHAANQQQVQEVTLTNFYIFVQRTEERVFAQLCTITQQWA